MRKRCYFDHAASSPLTDVCLRAFSEYDSQDWAGANPNSLHTSGRKAFEALEKARGSLARSIGAQRPSEVIFTGGGTEANNLALAGISRAVRTQSQGKRNRVLVSSIEHDSVLDPAEALRREGFSVEHIPVSRSGIIDLESLTSQVGDDVALVCVMGANNEVGTVQPVSEVSRIAHAYGAKVHCDAVQAFGHVPFSVGSLGLDSASFAAHKLGGPVSCGALYIRSRTPLTPILVGGGQESGMRSGTQDVRNACAFAAVAKDAIQHLHERSVYLRGLSDTLASLCAGADGPALLTVDGTYGVAPEERLPNLVHFICPGHQTEGLVLALDDLGFEVSGGSACSSSSLNPSHVLTSMGVSRDLAFCALRVSFDVRTSIQDCLDFSEALRSVCKSTGARR